MTKEEAIEIILNEKRCVQRANECDRACESCDLVKRDTDILEAYDTAIEALQEHACGSWDLVTESNEDEDDLPKLVCSNCGTVYYIGEDDIFDFRKEWVYCPKCGNRNGGETE